MRCCCRSRRCWWTGRPASTARSIRATSRCSDVAEPHRVLAFGTWLTPEPACEMDHAVDALREPGEGFLHKLTSSTVTPSRPGPRHRRSGHGAPARRERAHRELVGPTARHKGLADRDRLAAHAHRSAPWPAWTATRQGVSPTSMPPMRGQPKRQRRGCDRARPGTAR